MIMAWMHGQLPVRFMNCTQVEFCSRAIQIIRWVAINCKMILGSLNQYDLFADAETLHGPERKISQQTHSQRSF